MGNHQTEKAFEEERLRQTITLAKEQLNQAKEAAEKKKSEIIEAKKDLSNTFQMYCPNWEKTMLFLPYLKIYLMQY